MKQKELEEKRNYWGNLFRSQRNLLGKTQEEMCFLSNITRATLWKIEKGKPVAFDSVLDYAEALNLVLEVKNPVDSNLLTASYLMQIHKEINKHEAENLLNFCKEQTITHKECYGNADIMFPMWRVKK